MAVLTPVRIVYFGRLCRIVFKYRILRKINRPDSSSNPSHPPPHIYAQKASPIFLPERLVCFLPSFLTRRGAVDLFNYKCIELFNDSFYSFFAFNSYNNYTLRSSDYSVA